MTILITLISFLFGFTLGRKTSAKKKKPSLVKTGEVFGIGNFLSYDGTEQKS